MALNVFELAGKIVIDHSKALAAIAQTSKEATGIGNAFSKSEKAAGKSLAQIAAENGKTVSQVRSEVMKVASAYQKQGMSASDAMKKAYADIGYSAEKAHDKMDKNMDDSAANAERSANKMSAVFKKVGAAVAAAFSVRAIVDFGKQCTNAYASIAAEESAFAQIMGDYADTAQAKLNAVSDATGVSATRMTGAMTSLTAKFKGLGYNVEDATTLASDGLLIASDAAAFWDMSLDESMSHLNSFINGSYEGGEAIGLFANDTQMAAYAIEKGIVKDTKAWAALDEATRQATRLDYAKNMMEQSGATGQALKEADAYANVMANLKESWRQFQGVVGKPILEKIVLPAMQKLLKIMPGLTEAVQVGIDWLSAGLDKIASYFTDVFTEDGLNMEALPDALANMFKDLGAAIPGLLRSIGRIIAGAWEFGVWPLLQGLFKATLNVDLPSWGDLKQRVVDWWDGGNGIAQAIANTCNWTLNLFGMPGDVSADDVSNTLSPWWEKTKALVQSFCSWALLPFGMPGEVTDVSSMLSTWWEKTKTLVQNFCTWMLLPFGEPASMSESDVSSKLSAWWTNTKALVQKACSWILNPFGAPNAMSESDVANIISTWWTNTKALVQKVCSWILNPFGAPADLSESDVSSNLSTWWPNTKALVQKVCSWTLNPFGAPNAMSESDVSSKLSTWWPNTKALVQKACNWTLSLFGMPSEDGETIKGKIDTWWSGIWLEIGENLCTITSFFNTPDGVVKQITDWWDGIVKQLSLTITASWGGITDAWNNFWGTGNDGGSPDEDGTDASEVIRQMVTQLAEDEENGGGTGSPVFTFAPDSTGVEQIVNLRTIRTEGTSGSNMFGILQAAITEMQNMPKNVAAAVADSFGDVTVTANITTGDVTLDGVSVGKQAAPYVDLRLGWKNGLATRGV